jgi:hypothetical protein
MKHLNSLSGYVAGALVLGLLASGAGYCRAAVLELSPGFAGILNPLTAATTGAGAVAWQPDGLVAGVAIATDLDANAGGFGYVVDEAAGRIAAGIAPGVVLAFSQSYPVPAGLQVDTPYYLIATTEILLVGDAVPPSPYLKTEDFILRSQARVPEANPTALCLALAGLGLWAFTRIANRGFVRAEPL